MAQFKLDYWMLNVAGLILAALLMLLSPVVTVLMIGSLVCTTIFCETDVSTALMIKFGRKPEESYLKDAVVWITGASSGIGEELAYKMSSVGATVVLSARNEKELKRVAENCKALNCKSCLVVPMDVTEFDTHRSCLEKVVGEYGKIDVLVNNAGVLQQGFFADTDFKVAKQIIDVDLLGQLSLTRVVVEHMKDNHVKGLISFVCSIAKIGMPYMAVYSSAKSGLSCFADALRVELLDCGIDVQTLIVGPVKTKIAENGLLECHGELGGEKGSNAFFMQIKRLMSASRAAELISFTLANRTPESWVIKGASLPVMYLYSYIPATVKWAFSPLLKRFVNNVDKAIKN